MPIDLHLQTLWREYQDAERSGQRAPMLAALNRFVEQLLSQGPAVADDWALGYAARHAASTSSEPIRFVLAQRVLAPALVRGVLGEAHGCARSLAHLLRTCGHDLSSELARLPEPMQSPDGLLLEALRLDPGDTPARRELVDSLARYLRHTLHELPSGVLYGTDGASLTECYELLATLREFKTHVDLLGDRGAFSDLVRDCEYHYQKYREYLRSRSPGDDYQGFLARDPEA